MERVTAERQICRHLGRDTRALNACRDLRNTRSRERIVSRGRSPLLQLSMSTSIAEFWKLLEKSRLVGPEHCHALAQQFGQLKGVGQQGNAQTLAEWLVAQQAISRYQAKVLLAGKSGPFFYDSYVLFDRVADGPLKGCFRALHSGITAHRRAAFF